MEHLLIKTRLLPAAANKDNDNARERCLYRFGSRSIMTSSTAAACIPMAACLPAMVATSHFVFGRHSHSWTMSKMGASDYWSLNQILEHSPETWCEHGKVLTGRVKLNNFQNDHYDSASLWLLLACAFVISICEIGLQQGHKICVNPTDNGNNLLGLCHTPYV